MTYKKQKKTASIFAGLFKEDPELVMSLLDELVDLFVITDRIGTVLYASKACKAVTGYEQDELDGAAVEALMPFKKYPEMEDGGHKKLMLEVDVEQSEVVNHLRQVHIKNKDGGLVPTEVAVACLGDPSIPDDKPWFIASIRDRRLEVKMAKTIRTLKSAIEIATED